MSTLLLICAKLELAETQAQLAALPKLARRIKQAREDVEDSKVHSNEKLISEPDVVDIQTQLKESADLIIALLGRDKTQDLRHKMKESYDKVISVQKLFEGLSKDLMSILGAKEDDEELDESKIGMLSDALKTKAKDLDDYVQIATLLKSYESKAPKQDSSKPVLHNLPSKNKKPIKEDSKQKS